MSFEIFNFVWIQYHLFVNIKLSRTVVSSRNTVCRKQVILHSFTGVSMHTIARWFLELLSLRDQKRESWQNSVIKEDIDIVGSSTLFVGIMRKRKWKLQIHLCQFVLLMSRPALRWREEAADTHCWQIRKEEKNTTRQSRKRGELGMASKYVKDQRFGRLFATNFSLHYWLHGFSRTARRYIWFSFFSSTQFN